MLECVAINLNRLFSKLAENLVVGKCSFVYFHIGDGWTSHSSSGKLALFQPWRSRSIILNIFKFSSSVWLMNAYLPTFGYCYVVTTAQSIYLNIIFVCQLHLLQLEFTLTLLYLLCRNPIWTCFSNCSVSRRSTNITQRCLVITRLFFPLVLLEKQDVCLTWVESIDVGRGGVAVRLMLLVYQSCFIFSLFLLLGLKPWIGIQFNNSFTHFKFNSFPRVFPAEIVEVIGNVRQSNVTRKLTRSIMLIFKISKIFVKWRNFNFWSWLLKLFIYISDYCWKLLPLTHFWRLMNFHFKLIFLLFFALFANWGVWSCKLWHLKWITHFGYQWWKLCICIKIV